MIRLTRPKLSKEHPVQLGMVIYCVTAVALLLILITLSTTCASEAVRSVSATVRAHSTQRAKVLVSYSYFEKDEGQRENFKYFLLAGMGIHGNDVTLPTAAEFVIVISGKACAPCDALYSHVGRQDVSVAGVSAVWTGQRLAILQRSENVGMDFAAHNATLEYLKKNGTRKLHYRHFIFLNSSVRGPFYPSYMPASWQWTDAFVHRLNTNVPIVSSSLVCLPAVDAGGYGPKVESWAFAIDAAVLPLLVQSGVFHTRTCKLCDNKNGIVVGGEYALSEVLLHAGHNLATLMSRYAATTDWRDKSNWSCNDNVHPSRHGTYDGISMHPYETMFVKESWHVGEPHLSRYTKWAREHYAGRAGTEGSFHEDLYRYAISEKGGNPDFTADIFVPKLAQ